MSNVLNEGYGVCRTVEDAKHNAQRAKEEGLRGCYPAAAVVLAAALAEAEHRIANYEQIQILAESSKRERCGNVEVETIERIYK